MTGGGRHTLGLLAQDLRLQQQTGQHGDNFHALMSLLLCISPKRRIYLIDSGFLFRNPWPLLCVFVKGPFIGVLIRVFRPI